MSTPFHDLDKYIALPRTGRLCMSADGARLVASVQTLDKKRLTYRTAWWEIDPAGIAPARRLTHGTKGESQAVFTADGDLVFLASRDDDDTYVYRLPRDGGEAVEIARRPGGFDAVIAARQAPVLLLTGGVHTSARDEADHERLTKLRKETEVTAILHEGYPVRLWDHDLGPTTPHLFSAQLTADAITDLKDLTPGLRAGLDDQESDLSSDGSFVVTSLTVTTAQASTRSVLVTIETATGNRRTVADLPEYDFFAPRFSSDGRFIAFVAERRSTTEQAPTVRLGVVGADGGEITFFSDWDAWPSAPVWLPDGSGFLVVADTNGRAPIFRLGLDGQVTQVTSDDAAFSSVHVSPDGSWAYAMRSSYNAPAHPVRIGLTGATVMAEPLPAPTPLPELPGVLTEVETTTDAGVRVRAWLAQPVRDDPAPLLLWVHGGPIGSWNDWSWRWNPWILVAQGYAVLLPDPALSTGYGDAFIQRGWSAWGTASYDDLMAITDVVVARADIDETRTAAMGGSFGGYMANWIAGHTDRFDAIVSHAGLWALDQFGPTTDDSSYWTREMTTEMAQLNSPHLAASQITTPMLLVHGDRDYRVPIGEALRAWYQLLSESSGATDAEGRTHHRFLYFPDENHWVLRPQHAKVWYQVVEAFLAEHVLGLAGEGAPTYPHLLT